MGSGRRQVVINTQERAISTDINRLQAFDARDTAEAWRQLLDVNTDFFDPGFVSVPTIITPQQGAEIFGGLMVRPAVGSFDLTIDAGVAYLMSPDGGADDSNYKYVRETGVAAGVVSMTANASGSTRIDVIECRINPVPTVVTDSRDIFNPTTGLFTASAVTKETAFRLEFRVRAGTPGAGYPAHAGWMILAVASVPTGTTNNDTITFWDVRPLISDRVQPSPVGVQGQGTQTFRPRLTKQELRVIRVSATEVRLNGYFEAEQNGRRLGGEFRRGGPGTDTADIDVAHIDNQEAAITEPLTSHVFLYALCPFGLPRWARYTNAPSARLPRTTKGLLVASYTKPTLWGYASTLIALPTTYGFVGGTTNEGVCVAVITKTGGNLFAQGLSTERTWFPSTSLAPSINAVSLVGSVYSFDVTEAMWPPNAKAVLAEFFTSNTYPATSFEDFLGIVRVYATAGATGAFSNHDYRGLIQNPFGAPTLYALSHRVWLPLPVTDPVSSPLATRRVTWDAGTVAGTLAVAGSASMVIKAVRF